ncbi:MAG: cyanophycin synthetase, partial [Calditrichota bacterium]
ELDPAISLKLAGDKQLSATLLSRLNLPVPNCRSFHRKDLHKAEAFRQQLGGIVVVKPSRGTSSGTGITAGLSTAKEFRKAFFLASLYDSQVLVEEFIAGDNIRLLVIGDNVVSAVKRIPATVIGDGSSSIKQLIKIENQRRKSSREMPRLWPIEHNADMQLTLKRTGLTLGSKPKNGAAVQVKTICNGHQGGSVEEVTSLVHPDFNTMAVEAAKALGIVFAGVDLITPDISASPDDSSKINEVNTTPSLYGHYLAQNRAELRDPAADLLKYIFQNSSTMPQSDIRQ